MKHLAALLVILLFGACAAAPPADLSAAHAVLQLQQEAWNDGDLEAFLAAGYLPGSELSFYSSSPPVSGYDAVLERYRRSYQAAGKEMGRLRFDQIESEALGANHALVRGSWRLEFSDGTTSDGWFTLVMVHTADGWRIRHDHTSSSTDS